MKRVMFSVFLTGAAVILVKQQVAAQATPTAPESQPVAYKGTLLVQMRVADLDRSITFYRDVLGLRLKLRNDALHWAKFDTGIKGVTIGVGEGPEVKGSGSVSINLGVDDIEAARALLESRGVTFKGDTITIPDVVKLADLSDPDGNRIRLAQSLANDE